MSVRLHKQYGLNPSMSTCLCCGEGASVLLLGDQGAKFGEAPRQMVYGIEVCSACEKLSEENDAIWLVAITEEDQKVHVQYRHEVNRGDHDPRNAYGFTGGQRERELQHRRMQMIARDLYAKTAGTARVLLKRAAFKRIMNISDEDLSRTFVLVEDKVAEHIQKLHDAAAAEAMSDEESDTTDPTEGD